MGRTDARPPFMTVGLDRGNVHRGNEKSGAVFSACENYRYTLWRIWGGNGLVQFIGLNPSTADHERSDPTVTRCINFARRWGYGGLVMTNIFAFRATHPRDMKSSGSPIGRDNDEALKVTRSYCTEAVAAWGVHGTFWGREEQVANLLLGRRLVSLGETKAGHPRHPLYIPADTDRKEWSCGS